MPSTVFLSDAIMLCLTTKMAAQAIYVVKLSCPAQSRDEHENLEHSFECVNVQSGEFAE